MKKRSIKKNYIYNMLYQLFIIVLPIITTPYLARRLGAAGNGIFGYTVSVLTFFMIFGSLGIYTYGQIQIAYCQNDKEKRSKVFYELFLIKLVTMSIATVVFYFAFVNRGIYACYYRILLIQMLADTLDISWLYQGMEDFKKTAIRSFIVRIIGLISIFLFVKTPKDVSTYLYIYVLTNIFGSILLWLGVHKHIGKPKDLKFKYHFIPILTLFIPQVAIQVYTMIDKTMLGSILDDMSEVGYYEQSQKIIKTLLTVITAVGTVMMPRIASCFAEGNDVQIKAYMKKTFNFVFLLAFPLMFGIIVVANNFTPLFLGAGYDKVPMIMSILSMIVLFISLSNVTGTQFLLPTKRQKEYTISVVVGAVINIILNFILIKNYQSNGAAIATVIAEFTVMAVQFYFVRKNFKITDIVKLSYKYLVAGIVMFMACLVADKLVDGRFVSLIAQVSVGIVTYFGTLYVLRDRFFIDLINDNIIRRFKKNN